MAIDRDRPLLCFVHSVSGLDTGWDLIDRGCDSWELLDVVQVRGKALPTGDLERMVGRWKDALARCSTLIVVNDRVDVALATGADGVHVGRSDLPVEEVRALAPTGFVVGASARSPVDLAMAEESGADYTGLGAFATSTTKPDAVVLDLGSSPLRKAVAEAAIPVLAIGGITANRVEEVFRLAPVSGVAVSAAIQGAPDPALAIQALRAAIDQAWAEHRVEQARR